MLARHERALRKLARSGMALGFLRSSQAAEGEREGEREFARTRNFDNDDYEVALCERNAESVGVLHVYVLSLCLESKKLYSGFFRAFCSFLTLKKQRFEKINALVFCSSTSRKS